MSIFQKARILFKGMQAVRGGKAVQRTQMTIVDQEYQSHRALHNLGPHDDNNAIDRERLETFIAAFSRGIGYGLRRVSQIQTRHDSHSEFVEKYQEQCG